MGKTAYKHLPPMADDENGACQSVPNLSDDRILTPAEAAGMLDISEKLLGWHLDDGTIPHHIVGGHPGILLRDVLEYKEDRERRSKAMDEIVALSEEMGLYSKP